MNIEKTIQEDRQAKLVVEYSPQEFEGYKRRAAKQIAKDTRIPGFRPGKAPYSVILNRYGEDAILQEALDILLDDDYSKMLDQAEIKPSGAGNLESVESFDPPKLIFMVPLEPDIDLGAYREIRKDYHLEDFDVEEVDNFINNLRRNAATLIPADHPAEEGNLVYFNLSGEFLNTAEGEEALITDKTPQQVLIPAKTEISDTEWPFPGFARALLGVEAGESREVQHVYPEDDQDENFRGKMAVFTAEVQSVKELELPEIDQEFIDTFGDYESPEAFRESIETHLRQERQESYDENFFEEILGEIMEQATVTYPPQMLEHEAEHVLEDIQNRLADQNLDLETFLKIRETDEETFKADQVLPIAEERLQRSLVIDALIEAEALELKEDAIQVELSHVLDEVLKSGKFKEMQEQMGQEGFSQGITMEAAQRALVGLLQERLKLIATGQPIPVEEENEEEEIVEEDTGSVDTDTEGKGDRGTTDDTRDPEPTASEEDLEAPAGDQAVDEIVAPDDKPDDNSTVDSEEEASLEKMNKANNKEN